MKKNVIRMAALLLCLLLAIPFAGCGKDPQQSSAPGSSAAPSDGTSDDTSAPDSTPDVSGDPMQTGGDTSGEQTSPVSGGTKATGGSNNSGDKTNSSVGTTKANDTPAGTKKLFDKRSGVKGEVRVFMPWDTSGDSGFQKMVEEFKKEYPGTTVKIITGEWGTRDIKLMQLIRSESSPDYVPTGVFDFPKRAIKKTLMPLDSYIQPCEMLDTYIMDNVTVWEGKKYAIIGKRSPGVVFYNTTMLKNAGIAAKDMPYELWKRNEWTWDTLKTMARTLTVDKNKDGKPDVYGFGTETEFIFPLARGTDIVKNGGGKATLNIDDENWRSSLLFYYDGVNKDKIFTPVRWSIWEEFANGNVAMYYGVVGDADKLLTKGMKNWAIAPFPKYRKNDKSFVGHCTSDGFGVATGAKNPIGGIAFGEFQYNYYKKQSQSGTSTKIFTQEQSDMMESIESRISWLYGYGMEDSFCQAFGNYMRKNGDFSALMEEMRPIWQKNLDDTLKGR